MALRGPAEMKSHLPGTSGSAEPATVMGNVVGFFFSFRVVIVLLSVNLLGADPRTGTELNLACNFFLLGLVWFYSLGAPTCGFASMFEPATTRWVMIFLTFSLCSLLWSATVSLPASLAYWCGTSADVTIIVLLLRTHPVTAVASSVMRGFIWSTCCLALIAWIMPAQPDLRLGNEEFFNANQIGNLCAFAIFLAQYLMRRKDGSWGLAAIFLAITLLRSLSKTTLVAFSISQTFLVIQDRSMRRRTKLLLSVATALVILAFWGLIEAYYDVYTNAGNQAETLTGRIGIWAYFLGAALEQPWLGHGFDSAWKVVPPFGPFEARHAENELLQQFYAYGAAGIVLLIALYSSLYVQLRRMPRGPLRVLFVSLLLFIVVRGLAEAEPFDLLLPLWAIVLMSMLMDRLRQSGAVASASESIQAGIGRPLRGESAIGTG